MHKLPLVPLNATQELWLVVELENLTPILLLSKPRYAVKARYGIKDFKDFKALEGFELLARVGSSLNYSFPDKMLD